MYKALLVDDKEIFVREIERLDVWGDNSGFRVAGRAANGADALGKLRAEACDLVITDICMPGLDGIGLLRIIKEEALCPCVVLFSEYSEFEYARRGLIHGAFDYLVKPVDEQGLKQLLERATLFLREKDARSESAGEFSDAERNGDLYAASEEKRLRALIGIDTDRIPDAFSEAVRRIRQFLHPHSPKPPYLIHRLYLNIVAAIFEKYPWLNLYTFYPRYENPKNIGDGEDDLRRILEELTGFIHEMLPTNIQGTLHSICDFILENPEAEINLPAVSEKFFINHTYLSNLFRQKTGRRFNEYVTLVRMSRARCLIEQSDLKIYEISNRLGYNDADYFNRLFKKFSGKTPTVCRKTFPETAKLAKAPISKH
jgi:two-component system response regulator YesN